jgi:hypothetical protein
LGFREPLVDTIAQVALSLYQINVDVRDGSKGEILGKSR